MFPVENDNYSSYFESGCSALLSNLSIESEGENYRKVLFINIFLNAGITLIIVFLLIPVAHLVMRAYGSGFEEGTPVLIVLAFTAVLMATNGVIGQAIASKGKMWIGFTFNSLWAIVLLITTTIFLDKGYGAIGLALATLIAYVFHMVWQSVYLSKITGIMPKHQ